MSADNRSPKIRALDDIRGLARMASINYCMIERGFCQTRSVGCEDGVYTFKFSDNWTDDIVFAARDLKDRANSICERLSLFEEEEEESQ